MICLSNSSVAAEAAVSEEDLDSNKVAVDSAEASATVWEAVEVKDNKK